MGGSDLPADDQRIGTGTRDSSVERDGGKRNSRVAGAALRRTEDPAVRERVAQRAADVHGRRGHGRSEDPVRLGGPPAAAKRGDWEQRSFAQARPAAGPLALSVAPGALRRASTRRFLAGGQSSEGEGAIAG